MLSFFSFHPHYDRFFFPISHCVQTATNWMTVIVAANRYIAVCHPLHAHSLCSKKKVQLQLFLLLAAVSIYNIPRFFENKYVLKNITDLTTNCTTEIEDNIGWDSYTGYRLAYKVTNKRKNVRN